MGQRVLGLDLGTYSIKATLIERGWQEFTVLNFFERLNDRDSALNPYQQIAYNLQKFLEDYPVPEDVQVVTAVPAHWTGYRFFELPFSNPKKIEQAMEFELENFIPLEVDKIWWHYHVGKRGKRMSQILCAYTPLEGFRQLMGALSQNNLNPRQVGGEAFDFASLAQIAMLPKSGQYALIDFGHGKTSIVILDGDTLQYVRTISLGSGDLTAHLAAKMGKTLPEAEALKHQAVRLDPDFTMDPLLKEGVTDFFLQEWLPAVRQTFAAYGKSGADRRVEAVYLLGGGSRLGGVDKFLMSQLKINVLSLNSLAFVPHHLPNYREVMPAASPSFAIALSSFYVSRQAQLNFRKGEFAYRGDIEGIEMGLKKVAMWLLMVVGAGLLHYTVSHYAMSGKVEKVENEARGLLGQEWKTLAAKKNLDLNTALSVVNGAIQDLETKRTLLAGQGGTASPLFVLKEFSAAMPKRDAIKIDIDQFNMTETLVRIEGKTTLFESVDKIRQALERSRYFSNVKIDSKGKEPEVNFTLTFALKAVEA